MGDRTARACGQLNAHDYTMNTLPCSPWASLPWPQVSASRQHWPPGQYTANHTHHTDAIWEMETHGGFADTAACAGQLAAPPFLEGVVKPIYDFLAYEIQQCREQDVSKRVRLSRALCASP